MKKSWIITSAIFLIISLLAIGIIVSCTKAPAMADGVWTGTADSFKGPMEVSITVENGKIVEAELIKTSDSEFALATVDQILAQAVKKGSANGLDTVSGATYTSKGTINALKAASAAANGTAKEPQAAKPKDTETDVVIIGGGGAGLSAAVAARQAGVSVIVLEKMAIVGGNTNYATGGLNASETSVQAKLGIQDSNEQFYEDTMTGGKNLNNPDLVHTLVEDSAATVDWLIELGADMNDVGKMAGSTNSRTHRPTGGAAVGPHLVEVLAEAAEKLGADIRVNNEVVDIIKTGNRVSGVEVKTPQGEYTIKAKAVIIATGGFGASPETIVTYKPELEGFGTTNHAGATGDAIKWANELELGLVDMEQIQTHPTVVPGQNLMITEAVRGNGAILVNREGKRFGSEMATRDVMSSAILAQTGKTAFLVFDQGVRESLKAIETYAKQGLLTEGATIADLADKLGIPATNLENTIATYNKAVASGKDTEFGRKASEMPRELATGPYYAVEVGPAVHHTMGGLEINTKAEVIGANDQIIPGLFAAGEVTGGVHGANRLGGNAVADIAVFGRIAGEEAALYVNNLK